MEHLVNTASRQIALVQESALAYQKIAEMSGNDGTLFEQIQDDLQYLFHDYPILNLQFNTDQLVPRREQDDPEEEIQLSIQLNELLTYLSVVLTFMDQAAAEIIII